MKDKKIMIPVIACAAVVAVCIMYYIDFSEELNYRLNPYDYSPIAGYETKTLGEIPEGYQLPAGAVAGGAGDLKVVEISYELVGIVNETMDILRGLCYYTGQNDVWVYQLEKDREYWGIESYVVYDTLPPGEHIVYKEYVLVPENAEWFKVYWAGSDEGMVIEL